MDKATGVSIERKPQSTALSPADKQLLRRSGLIVAQLTKLAVVLGEPMDAQGLRLRLMAEDLSDLPAAAVEHAIAMWRRGDRSHLKHRPGDYIRVGAFFPKPAELREIAEFHLAQHLAQEGYLQQQREAAEERERDLERVERERRERAAAEPVGEVAKTAESKRCPRCGGPLPVRDHSPTTLTRFSPEELRLMADHIERQLKASR